MWCLRKDFDVLIKKTWCTRLNGSFMFRFVQKCKILKGQIKDWNKVRFFFNVFRQVQEVYGKLSTLHSRLLNDPSNVSRSLPY